MLTEKDKSLKIRILLNSLGIKQLYDSHVIAYEKFLKKKKYPQRKFIILGPGSLTKYPNLKQMLSIDRDRYWCYVDNVIPVEADHFYSKICISDLHPAWPALTLMFPDLIQESDFSNKRNKYRLFLTKMIASDSDMTINNTDFKTIIDEGVEITDLAAIK
ncbi:MAG: hypothetical protein RI886_1224 [Pseudomonadota bacterium]|jgi:hypothetical protein